MRRSYEISRRLFVHSAATAAVLFEAQSMDAKPVSLPIGLQLYTVGKEMESDPAGTLKQVAAAGYTHVELSPLAKMPVKELRAVLDGVGLKNPSGHYMLYDLLAGLQNKVDEAKELGEDHMIVTVPWVADISHFKKEPGQSQTDFFIGVMNGLTLDDHRWNAEQFNKIGEQVKKSGLQLGYHNHNFGFRNFGDTSGYDEFLHLTDPDLVKLELDCGWVTVAGKDPVAYLEKYPDRYHFLHFKDFKKGFTPRTTLMDNGANTPVATELGRGSIDYTKILKAARNTNVRAVFVEQKLPFVEMPASEATKVAYQYMRNLKV